MYLTPPLNGFPLELGTDARGQKTKMTVHRPTVHGVPVGTFCDQLSDFLDEVLSLSGELTLCGDLNYAGVNTGRVDIQLENLLFSCHLVQRVRGATHAAGNLLDVVITAERSTICLLPIVVDTGFSDHKLVLTDLSVGRVKSSHRKFQYRKVKTTDAAAFGDLFCTQPVVTSPSTDVNEYVDQLERSVLAVLDVLVPLKTVTKRGGRPSSRLLSEVAVDAKRTRRRLERRWNSTGCEADHVAYRKACRHTNLEITRSRQSFTQQRLTEAAADQKAQCKIIKELLHGDDRRKVVQSDEARCLSSVQQIFHGQAEAHRH